MSSDPILYVLSGEPGVGKTAVAGVISDEYNADHYRSDRLRKEYVVPEMGRDEPRYDHEESQRTYDELYNRARDSLRNGRSAVLDATFSIEYGRYVAATVAEEMDVPVEFVRVICREEVARERIRARTESESELLSDADIIVYESIKDDFEPLDRPHTVIDNSSTLEETRRQVRAKLSATHD